MVIIVCKEIWYYVRTDKTTFFIEWYCQWTIARSNLQNSILSAVFLDDKVNQSFCIAFALMLLINQQAVEPKSCIRRLLNYSVHGKTHYAIFVIGTHGMPRRQLIRLFHIFRNTFDKPGLVW